MYIRRKVFSVALDEYGEERLFSTNEIINEDDYLDEVMYSDYYDDDLDERLYTEISVGGKKYHFTNAQLSAMAGKENVGIKDIYAGLKDGKYKKYLKEGKLYEGAVEGGTKGQYREIVDSAGRKSKIRVEKAADSRLGDTIQAGGQGGRYVVDGQGRRMKDKYGRTIEIKSGGEFEAAGKEARKAEEALVKKHAKNAQKNPRKGRMGAVGGDTYHRANAYRNDAFRNPANDEALMRFEKAANRAQRGRDIRRALTGRNAKIAYGVGAAAGLGYGGYRLYKNHKSQED